MFLFLKLVIDSGILPSLVNLLGHPEVNVVVRTWHKKINSHFKFSYFKHFTDPFLQNGN